MKSIEYEQIGKKIKVGEDVLISPDYYDDGLSFGTIFKDERAFYEQPDEVCYVPEAVFAEGHPEIINGKEYYSASMATHVGIWRNFLKEKQMMKANQLT